MSNSKKLLVLLAASPLVGCSSMQPKTQQVRIDTVPSGMHVRVDGEDRGPSPVNLVLERNTGHTIVAVDDTRVYMRELNRKMSTTGKIDMIGGAMFMLPGLGLLTPGAWELDTTNVVLGTDAPPAPRPPLAAVSVAR